MKKQFLGLLSLIAGFNLLLATYVASRLIVNFASIYFIMPVLLIVIASTYLYRTYADYHYAKLEKECIEKDDPSS